MPDVDDRQRRTRARRQRIDELLDPDPLLDPSVSDADRAILLVDAFRSVLAARAWPLLERP